MLVWQAVLLLVLLIFTTVILGRFFTSCPNDSLQCTARCTLPTHSAQRSFVLRAPSAWLASLLASVLVTAATYAFAFAVIMLVRIPVSPVVVVAKLRTDVVVATSSAVTPHGSAGKSSPHRVLLALGVFVTRQQSVAKASSGKQVTTTTFASAFYPLEIKTYTRYVRARQYFLCMDASRRRAPAASGRSGCRS